MDSSNRREFLRKAAVGSVSVAAGFAASGLFPRRIFAESPSGFNRVVYRNLGSTGCKVSEIGFGVLHTRDSALIHAAIDEGINFFDTAHSYMNGVCEKTLGEVMKTRRDKVFLTTKISRAKPKKMTEMIATSLKRLQTDHVDLLLLHGARNRKQILNEDIIKTFDDARRNGMTRFVGISTHNQVEVLDAAVESKFWEAALVPYNYFSPPSVSASIKKARIAGLGIIGMKSLITIARPRKPFPDIRKGKTDKTTNQQALLKWALENLYVDTLIPGISSFEHLADDIAVMGTKLTLYDRLILRRYSEDTKGRYCRGIAGCTGCKNTCPKGVDVSEINRCINYAYGYGDIELARENYEELPTECRVDVCKDCEVCVVKCVHGLNLTYNVRLAEELFA